MSLQQGDNEDFESLGAKGRKRSNTRTDTLLVSHDNFSDFDLVQIPLYCSSMRCLNGTTIRCQPQLRLRQRSLANTRSNPIENSALTAGVASRSLTALGPTRIVHRRAANVWRAAKRKPFPAPASGIRIQASSPRLTRAAIGRSCAKLNTTRSSN